MNQQYSVTAAGRIINTVGNYFRYESAGIDAPVQELRVRADGNDLGTFLPGDSIELPVMCNNWELQPASGSASVRIGVGRVVSSRTSLNGSVSLIDSQTALTLDGKTFAVWDGITHAGGTRWQYALANPAGSGKVIVVTSLSVLWDAPNTTNTNFVSLRNATGVPQGAEQAGVYTKRIGAGAGVAKFYRAAGIAALDGVKCWQTTAQQLTELVRREPLVIDAGKTLALGCEASHNVDTKIAIGIEWREQ